MISALSKKRNREKIFLFGMIFAGGSLAQHLLLAAILADRAPRLPFWQFATLPFWQALTARFG